MLLDAYPHPWDNMQYKPHYLKILANLMPWTPDKKLWEKVYNFQRQWTPSTSSVGYSLELPMIKLPFKE